MSELIEQASKAIFDSMDVADGLDGTVAEKYARAALKAVQDVFSASGNSSLDLASHEIEKELSE